MSSPTRTRDAGRVVVVGGGLAGFSAAQTLRGFGHTGPVTVVDAEPALYDRPPLSKELFGDLSLDRLAFAREDTLRDLDLAVVTGRTAVALDPDAASVTLDDGTVLPADTVLLATGGRARRLDAPGGDLPQVHVLRTFADASGLRDAVRPGTRAVVLGAGLVGAELASSLLDAGAEVDLVDPTPVPLVSAVGELMATYLHDLHAARGVRLHAGVAERIDPDPGAGSGAVLVRLADGTALSADVVVVGIGIVPNTGLAQAAGLEVDDGIVVDEHLRSSAPRVFAAGDVARRRRPDGGLERREEHWEAAQLAGREAAAGMLGLDVAARGAPWFWSDRHGLHLEAVGRLAGPGEPVVRRGGEHPAVFLVHDGLLVGAASVDDAVTVRAARRLIDQRVPVDAAALADPSVALRSLLRAARG